MDINALKTSELKLFEFGVQKKLLLLSCAAILWIGALIAYFSPGFDYWVVVSFNSLRSDPSFASFWYYYTYYMLSVIILALLILYLASFKLNRLKPYRLVFFLAIITVAIGNPMVDIFKDFFARPRPWVTYPDINNLYYVSGLSLPSGHAFQAFAATLPLILCFLTNNETFKRSRKKVVLASLLLFFAINLALSRIFVGVHFLSDVLVGIGFAIILMVILASLLEWLLKTGRLNLQNEKWYAFVFVTLMLFNMIL